jgi:hypothetical protein
MERWTPDQIVEANAGLIPGTSEECQAVAKKLQEQADATGA